MFGLKNKKGALELSITAIVVLIIAITVLGLAIGFIKKQFGAGEQLVSSQFTEIRTRLEDQVKKGGELLVFNAPESLSIGKPEDFLLGVRNTAANTEGKGRVCFRVEVRCLKPFTPGETCASDVSPGQSVAVGGYNSDGWVAVQKDESRHNWFNKLNSEFDIKDYDGAVYNGVMQVRSVKPDSYSMEVNIYKEAGDRDCSNQQFGDKTAALYASKSFVLNVV